MKKNLKISTYTLALSAVLMSCTAEPEIIAELVLDNSYNQEQNEIAVDIDLNQLMLEEKNAIDWNNMVVVDHEIVPTQLIDKNNDGKPETLLALIDFKPSSKKTLTIRALKPEEKSPTFPKRTQAEISIKEGGKWEWIRKKNGNEQFEYQGGKFINIDGLKVPKQHTDHSFYIRYEGPGWESDKVGYRFYLDWRNAVDVFGKKTSNLVLQHVGQDGFDSYHLEADWGMDILKVGSTLGLGTIAYWDKDDAHRVAQTDSLECHILQNGNIKSSFETNYFGWEYTDGLKTNMNVLTSITAGSRLTVQNLTFSKAPNNICTGIIKHPDAQLIQSENKDGEWSYLATFGKQSLNNDMMGLAVFYKTAQLQIVTEAPKSHVVVLIPKNNKLSYAFAATWEKDTDQIATKHMFTEYLNAELDRINNAPNISYNK